MTFQQLEYIVAVDKFRHFVNAATACGVTQSTLSSTIQKLEQEIDVIIFDRSKHPIEPTALGKRIISQAKVILHNSSQLRELVQSEKEQERGKLLIGMLPTVAPFLYPEFTRIMNSEHPNIFTHIEESSASILIERLQRAELDLALLSPSMIQDTNLIEIEIFTERFVLYTSPSHPLYGRDWVMPEDLQDGDLWVLSDFHERYPQLSDIVHHESFHHAFLETGSLNTLVRLVDTNGGYTVLPQLYAKTLSSEQQKNIRNINSGKYFRSISLVIRQDFMRERMLNIVADSLKRILPDEMINSRLKKFKITL